MDEFALKTLKSGPRKHPQRVAAGKGGPGDVSRVMVQSVTCLSPKHEGLNGVPQNSRKKLSREPL